MITSLFPRAVSISAVAATLFVCNLASASQCRGLEQQICATDDSCIWIAGYTRKDGRSVSSHCKLRRANKSDTEAGVSQVKLNGRD